MIKKLGAEFFLAWRYFTPKRNAVSIITLISIIGVMLGVGILIIVLSVMGGFSYEMQKRFIDTGSHVILRNNVYSCFRNPVKIINDAEKVGINATPITMGQALIQSKKRFEPKGLIGFDPTSNTGIFNIKKRKEYLKYGKLPFNRNEVLISPQISSELGVTIGDKILVHSPRRLTKLFEVEDDGKVTINKNSDMYLPTELTVSGIYNFDQYKFDSNFIFTNIDDANELFDYPWGSSNFIYGWVEKPFKVDSYLDKLKIQLKDPEGYRYDYGSWKTVNGTLLQAVQMEKTMMFFLMFFLVLIAAFSITNTLITMVIQKTSEIGLMKALGANSFSISFVFVLQGFFVGIIGSLSGVIFALTALEYRNDLLEFLRNRGLNVFPPELYYMKGLPAQINYHDISIIVVLSIVLCTFGAVIPALRAASLDPAKSLRCE
ncbi:ABC transporter permease [Lentisphaerota bacterium WC36G]|nr:ABC transporter permease [Lentisphaerae bacterium WC36]